MKEFGKLFGLAESTISGYENGSREPDLDTLNRFADFFGVTADYLLGRTDDPHGYVNDTGRVVPPEEQEFLRWIEDNLEDVFFYEFEKSPDEQKAEFLETVRIVWELHKRRMERQQKKGDEQGEGDY